ncbi:MAG: hypothetical protein CMJ18_19555 [Phycisphaeraceae bacterium]|nr:hypothetical protein [Phycisphaeraceae bacterium]
MKLSFMTFSCPTWPFRDVLDAAVQYGYHGIEFRCDADHRHGVEVYAGLPERQAMRGEMESASIEPCCLATSLQFAADHVMEEVEPRLQLAADMGIPAVRVFCGAIEDVMDRQEMIDQCIRHLRDAADLASQFDLQLWLETHDSICRAADCGAIVSAVAHPGVGINYDNMHPFRQGETVEESIAALGSHVRHTHMHDALADPSRVVVTRLDEGEMPMDDMFQALVNMGFTGYLSGEWFDEMYGANPEDALIAYRDDMNRLAERNGITLG